MTAITPSHMPATLVVDGLTYQYFSGFKVPDTLAQTSEAVKKPDMHVYHAYTEAQDIPTLLLTSEEAEQAYKDPHYRSRVFSGCGGQTVSLNEMRLCWHEQNWQRFNLAMEILAENFPVYLPEGDSVLRRFTHHYDPYTNAHPYKNADTGWMKFYTEQDIHELLDAAIANNGGHKEITAYRTGGYECSSVGSSRFSALNAYMPDGRTIEQWYQCGTLDGRGKGYEPGGLKWRQGKGKPPLLAKDKDTLWQEYYGFWDEWAKAHLLWMKELRWHASCFNHVLSDRFAATPINQARALAQWLNNNPF